MSTMTLDELLVEAGLTRDEWQRARVVVEDYWKQYAQLNGWGPLEPHVAQRTFRFPLVPDGEFTITAPLSEEQWGVLMDVLEAAKPGLVAESNTERQP